MTILKSDTVTGLEYSSVIPNAKARMLQQFKTIAEDQTALYKMTTNIDAPNTGSGSQADGHDHSGSGSGALLSTPLLTLPLNLQLRSDIVVDDWQNANLTPFYAPLGVTSVRLWAVFSNVAAVSNFRFGSVDKTYAINLTLPQSLEIVSETEKEVQGFIDLDVNENETNILRIQGWRGSTNSGNDGEIENCFLYSVFVLPSSSQPREVKNIAENSSIDDALFPSATQYGSNRFTSFDDGMFDDGLPLSSYVVTSCALNDALIGELISGQKTASRAAATMMGHSHEGHGSDLDKSGVSLAMTLGTWSYGAAYGFGGDYADFDSIYSSNTQWSGRTFGLSLKDTTSYVSIVRPFFRFPASSSARFASGTSDMRLDILIHNDNGKSSGVDFRVTIKTPDLSESGSSIVSSSSTTGKQLVTCLALPLPPIAAGADGEGEYVIEVEAKQGAANKKAVHIYGMNLSLR